MLCTDPHARRSRRRYRRGRQSRARARWVRRIAAMGRTLDVCIRGGGIVGHVLALLLARERLRVGLVVAPAVRQGPMCAPTR